MSRWPRDNQAELIAFYGDPGKGEVARQLVKVVPPFQMYYDGRPLKSISFHRKAAAALTAALNEIWEHYGRDQAKVDAVGVSKCAGTYNPRMVRGSQTKWSNHAFGAAIDLNAAENGMYAKGNIPGAVVAAFKRQGFRWGGDYRGRKDPMHFEGCEDARPVGIADLPEADGDSADPVDMTPPPRHDIAPDAEPEAREPRWKRWWGRITGAASAGGGLGFLGYATDWQVVAILCGFVLVIVIGLILFIGPSDVRNWIKEQFR